MSLFKSILKFSPIVGTVCIFSGLTNSVFCEKISPKKRIEQTGKNAIENLENKILVREALLELIEMSTNDLTTIRKKVVGDELKEVNDLLNEGAELLSHFNESNANDKDMLILIELGLKHLNELHADS